MTVLVEKSLAIWQPSECIKSGGIKLEQIKSIYDFCALERVKICGQRNEENKVDS